MKNAKTYSSNMIAKLAIDMLAHISDDVDATFQELYAETADMRLFRAQAIATVRQSYTEQRETKREAMLKEREAAKAFIAAEKLAATNRATARRIEKAEARQVRKVAKVEALREKLAAMESEIGN